VIERLFRDIDGVGERTVGPALTAEVVVVLDPGRDRCRASALVVNLGRDRSSNS
jgi:hypothetical protein